MRHDPLPHDPLPLEEVWRRLSERGTPSPELRSVAEAALERNARLATILDLRGVSDVTDFFVIATGDSDTRTSSIERARTVSVPSAWKG